MPLTTRLRGRRASSATLQSPFSPENNHILILISGSLYSATVVYFYSALDIWELKKSRSRLRTCGCAVKREGREDEATMTEVLIS